MKPTVQVSVRPGDACGGRPPLLPLSFCVSLKNACPVLQVPVRPVAGPGPWGGMRGPKRPHLGAPLPTASPCVAALVTGRGPLVILPTWALETGVDATRNLSCSSFAQFCPRPLDEGCPQEQCVHGSPGSQLGPGCVRVPVTHTHNTLIR